MMLTLYTRVKYFKVSLIFILLAFFLTRPFAFGQGSTIEADVKKAILAYTEKQTHELFKATQKKAITALYKQLDASGVNQPLGRKFGDTAKMASEINTLAEAAADAYSSNDPEKSRAAAETLAIALGNRMAKLAKTSSGKKYLSTLMGKAGTVKDVAGVLGALGTKQGNRAASEFVGQMLIDLTPAAGVIAFYKSAYGVMQYAENQFEDSAMEELYQTYKNSQNGEDKLIDSLYAGNRYGYITRKRMMEQRAKYIELIEDASDSASVKLVKHLTNSTDDDVINSILETFKNRRKKEVEDVIIKAQKKKFEKEAKAILQTLSAVVTEENKKGDQKKKTWDLSDFVERVRKALENDAILDPHNQVHIKAMSRLKAIALIYTKNSQEYKDQLAKIKKMRNGILRNSQGICDHKGSRLSISLKIKGERFLNKGKVGLAFKYMHESLKVCHNTKFKSELAQLEKDYATDKEKFHKKYVKQPKVSKAWTKSKRKRVMRRLARLNHIKFLDTMKILDLTPPDALLNCLCQSAGYGGSGTRQFYHPGTIGKFDKRYSCQHPGEPCVVAGYGCGRHPLPKNTDIWNNCIKKNPLKKYNDKIQSEVKDMRLDDAILKKLQQWQKPQE